MSLFQIDFDNLSNYYQKNYNTDFFYPLKNIQEYPDIYQKSKEEYLLEACSIPVEYLVKTYIQLTLSNWNQKSPLFYNLAYEIAHHSTDDSLIHDITQEIKSIDDKPIYKSVIDRDYRLEYLHSLLNTFIWAYEKDLAVPNCKKYLDYLFRTNNPYISIKIYIFMGFFFGNQEILDYQIENYFETQYYIDCVKAMLERNNHHFITFFLNNEKFNFIKNINEVANLISSL
jgi:hypothetical protein